MSAKHYKEAIEIFGKLSNFTAIEIELAKNNPSKFVEWYQKQFKKEVYQLIMKDRGVNVIPCIKEIRATNGIGLKEAKEMSETPGSVIAEFSNAIDASSSKSKFDKIGSWTEIVMVKK